MRYRQVEAPMLFGMLVAAFAVTPSARAAQGASGPHYRVVRKVALGGEGGWDYLNCDPNAQRLYISRGNRVEVVDLRHLKIVGQVSNTPGVHGVALDQRDGLGFTSNGGNSTVSIFNLKTLRTRGSVGVGQGPDAIVFDPASNRTFTMNGRGQTVTAINAATGKVDGTIALDGRPEFAAVDGRGHLYVNIENKSEMTEIDSRSLQVMHVWPLAPGEGPSGLAIDSAHRRLFSTADNGMMVVMDADTGAIVATPAIGRGPDAAGFDPGLQVAFSSNGRDGTLTLVREESANQFTVTQDLPTQAGARTLAVDTKRHRVYLVTALFGPSQPGSPPWRRTILPGSFTLIETELVR